MVIDDSIFCRYGRIIIQVLGTNDNKRDDYRDKDVNEGECYIEGEPCVKYDKEFYKKYEEEFNETYEEKFYEENEEESNEKYEEKSYKENKKESNEKYEKESYEENKKKSYEENKEESDEEYQLTDKFSMLIHISINQNIV